uniref:Uncharacterized protein n=1 Tax=Timema poppense TaxID=170557 RepID=A0A7R9DDS9_TIMPO|nr:unnamed protein product [Timema poppensis]
MRIVIKEEINRRNLLGLPRNPELAMLSVIWVPLGASGCLWMPAHPATSLPKHSALHAVSVEIALTILKLQTKLYDHFLPLVDHFLPLDDHFLPLVDHFLPLVDHFLPLDDHFLPLDVGKAAFYKTVEEARTLAHQIINVSKGLDVPTSVALTSKYFMLEFSIFMLQSENYSPFIITKRDATALVVSMSDSDLKNHS